MDPIQKLIRFYFVSHGFSSGIYKYSGRNQQTDKQLLEMADSFGAGWEKKLQFIYLSQVMPYAVTACKLGLGLCWKAGIAAEVIGIPAGSIGEKRVYKAKVYLETPDLFCMDNCHYCSECGFEKIFYVCVGEEVWRITVKGSIFEKISGRKCFPFYREL